MYIFYSPLFFLVGHGHSHEFRGVFAFYSTLEGLGDIVVSDLLILRPILAVSGG